MTAGHLDPRGKPAPARVVRFFDNGEKTVVRLQFAGQALVCTPEHPFYVVDRGWVCAEELDEGDLCLNAKGGTVAFISREALAETRRVYNIEVAEAHTYFVGDDDGVLAHNECKIHLPAEYRGVWESGTPGEGIFRYNNSPINQESGLVGVKVKYEGGFIAKKGFPKSFYYENNPDMATVYIDKVEGTFKDFYAADKKMKEKLNDPKWERKSGYTWRHSGKPGDTRMELIVTGYHRRVAHSGNAIEVRKAIRLRSNIKALNTLGTGLGITKAIDQVSLLVEANENAEKELKLLIKSLQVIRNRYSPHNSNVSYNEIKAEMVQEIERFIHRYDGNSSSLRFFLHAWWLKTLGKKSQ